MMDVISASVIFISCNVFFYQMDCIKSYREGVGWKMTDDRDESG